MEGKFSSSSPLASKNPKQTNRKLKKAKLASNSENYTTKPITPFGFPCVASHPSLSSSSAPSSRYSPPPASYSSSTEIARLRQGTDNTQNQINYPCITASIAQGIRVSRVVYRSSLSDTAYRRGDTTSSCWDRPPPYTKSEDRSIDRSIDPSIKGNKQRDLDWGKRGLIG